MPGETVKFTAILLLLLLLLYPGYIRLKYYNITFIFSSCILPGHKFLYAQRAV